MDDILLMTYLEIIVVGQGKTLGKFVRIDVVSVSNNITDLVCVYLEKL